MKNMKARLRQLIFCTVVCLSMAITGGSGYILYAVNAQADPEGCRGCLGQYECGQGTTCQSGCCPADCSAYVNSCQ